VSPFSSMEELEEAIKKSPAMQKIKEYLRKHGLDGIGLAEIYKVFGQKDFEEHCRRCKWYDEEGYCKAPHGTLNCAELYETKD